MLKQPQPRPGRTLRVAGEAVEMGGPGLTGGAAGWEGCCPSVLSFHQEHLPAEEAMPRSSWDRAEA